MTKTRPFLSTCYGYPSTTEVPPCCQAATKKLTFSTTSVLLLLNVPSSLSRVTVFRRQKNPRRGYRPKIAGILFVCNEPEGKYYTVPSSLLIHLRVTSTMSSFVVSFTPLILTEFLLEYCSCSSIYHLPPGFISLRKEEPLPELFPQTPVPMLFLATQYPGGGQDCLSILF